MKSGAGTYEYPKNSGIKISLVPNESFDSRNADREASRSYRATIPARLSSGKRKMKQFRTEKEAKFFAKEEWDNFRVLGEDFSDLTKEERKEAIKAVRMAREYDVGLMEALEFGIKRMCPEGGAKTVGEVVKEFIQIKERRKTKGDLKARSFRDAKSRGDKLSLLLGELKINEISGAKLKDSLLSLEKSFRTQRNYKSIWSEILRFAKQRKYILDNPFDELSTEDLREIVGTGDDWNPPAILSVKEAKSLLTGAWANPELDLLAAITLGLFCGIRTEEIKQLKWSDLKLDDSDPHLVVSREIAKKRRMRHVKIPPNAIEWLMKCEDRTGEITMSRSENDYQKRFRALHLKSGFSEKINGKIESDWKHNAMRHSFGTYHFAFYGDPLKTSVEMGHKTGDDVLFEHYRSLAKKDEAKEYFNIFPKVEQPKIIQFAS